ncbi:hypothetical protein H8R18_05555 [Nanchangia anserum]|uniref:Uncharacterized protein n=1 Tax=Nanchangia anserum TaxID=2692125 RepID=A0A8I0GBA1_9ACTO|nr:hypothetical protein [Nanchangia anserum]MBD3689005.1 hypothetical protein [Nanchangia anserum]QOX81252.1 hypothetical protein H8R18_05555 [Nanchangia anserum]
MTESLIVVVIALVVTVGCALAIVVSFVRTRRPDEGTREWVREATQAWKREELNRSGTDTSDLTIDDLLNATSPGDATDIEGLSDALGGDESQPVLPSYAPQRPRSRRGEQARDERDS